MAAVTRRRRTPWTIGVAGVTVERAVGHGDRMLDERGLHLPPRATAERVPE